jgi:predicted CXXCH cytochrome family protein
MNRTTKSSRLTHKQRWLLLIAVSVLAVGGWLALDWYLVLPAGLKAEYVGRPSCASCHAEQSKLWTGSDHDLAMDEATPEFVLGDFDNTQLEHHGVTSKMSRRGDDFFVETQGPDGHQQVFEVKYVFGVRPLQQYLAELDPGRLQVLPVSWDTNEKRWFYANPDAPFGPDDPLHWTGSAQNWNHMCADCHSTNFAKNYDVATDSHHWTSFEMDVSCEACHGPGSLHVELANSRSVFWDRRYGFGLAKLKDTDATTQLESCAPCHSRRRVLHPGFQPGDDYDDYHALALLDENLYFPDGQIQDEVYEYGSFLQSLMYRKGVRCSNCHDPHSAKVKFQDNRLCTQCHVAPKYDSPTHHHHKLDSVGARCVECHMPERTYMVVDPRRDHSIRIPRPDLSVKLGTPNACNKCHDKENETPQWAADRVVEWFGPKRRDDPHYGEIIAAARASDPAMLDQLEKLTRSTQVGPVVRATAASLMATHYPIESSYEAIERSLKHDDAIVRAAAVQAFERWPLESDNRIQQLRRLIDDAWNDKSRLVRSEAARAALSLPPQLFGSGMSGPHRQATDEYVHGLTMHADQAGSHVSLGAYYSLQGNFEAAKREYHIAIKLDPAVVGPRSNLAQILDQQNQSEEALKLRREEVLLLERDAKLLPGHAILQYRLGLLQYLLGDLDRAESSLKQAMTLEPKSTDFAMAVVLLLEKRQRWSDAQEIIHDFMKRDPNNPTWKEILERIRQASQSVKP